MGSPPLRRVIGSGESCRPEAYRREHRRHQRARAGLLLRHRLRAVPGERRDHRAPLRRQPLITLLIAIFLGGMAQRATGMGLALVAAPFIVVALGPAAGVVVANLLGVVGSAMVYARVRHSVDWRMLRRSEEHT